ncbi:MAG: DNA mismatch endonuclease Vsr [Rhodopirellula sp.]|nr:DNA mismatch endonuclease Vsr [Rhodopirellula sp.]
MDTFTKDKRRAIMQAVRRQRTRPEEALALLLRKAGVKFRRNVRSLPGSPDFYVPTQRLAVFIHGCFWHGHRHCAKGRSRPKSNCSYWRRKITINQQRDQRVARQLRRLGYSVYTVWECQLTSNRLPPRLLARLTVPLL